MIENFKVFQKEYFSLKFLCKALENVPNFQDEKNCLHRKLTSRELIFFEICTKSNFLKVSWDVLTNFVYITVQYLYSLEFEIFPGILKEIKTYCFNDF